MLDVKLFMGATWASDNTIIFGSIEHGLQRVSADGGVPQPITTPDRARSEIDHHFPKILPGGKAVMFTIHDGNERYRVGVQELATGERKVLLESGFDPQYSPTGHLVYGKGGSLFAVPFNVDRLELTGTPVKLLDDVATLRQRAGEFQPVARWNAGVRACPASWRTETGVAGSVGCGHPALDGTTAVCEPTPVARRPTTRGERRRRESGRTSGSISSGTRCSAR